MDSRFWIKHYDYNVPATIRYPKFPVQNLIHLATAQFPHKAAIDFYGSTLTFRQVRDQVIRLANAFIRFGVKKGDRIGIALPNCPQYIIGYYATLTAGAIVVNLNPLDSHHELKFLMENAGLETLVTFDGALSTMRPLALELRIKLVIVTKLTDYIKAFDMSTSRELELEKKWHHFSEILASSSDAKVPRITFTPDTPALIQFTAGTTGLPKGALLSHGNLVAAAFQCLCWGDSTIRYTPYEKRTVLGIIPYFHIYGNLYSMNWAFLNMATQILLPRFGMDELLGTFDRFDQITFFPTAPTMMTAILGHPKSYEINLPEKIRSIHFGEAPIPARLIKLAKDMGLVFSSGWGMSETASMGISNPVMAHKTGSVGVPSIDSDVRLVDLDQGTRQVKPGEQGEIIIKGPTVMKGYWNNPEETHSQLKDGWLRTGDIGRMDDDGYITIMDRKKDMIVAESAHIYPREVDEILYQHPKVEEAATVGIPCPSRRETIKAFLVLKEGQTASEIEIIKFCKEKLPPDKVPDFVEFRSSIPKSAVGKILRKVLREQEIAKINAS